jgi:uncharacterized protein (TIGR02246 family)
MPNSPAPYGGTAHQTAASDAPIRKCLNGWIEAVNSGQVGTICALYRIDAVLLATFDPKPLATPKERENYFVNFKARKGLKAAVDECHAQRLGDAAGTASGLYTFSFVENGAPQTARARFTFVYERQRDGQWLIAAHHSSVAPPPPKIV